MNLGVWFEGITLGVHGQKQHCRNTENKHIAETNFKIEKLRQIEVIKYMFLYYLDVIHRYMYTYKFYFK